MPGLKTNEIEGTRAVLRYCRMSAYKAREVLDLIRGHDVARAADMLRFSERDAARVVAKVLASAVANAQNNEDLDPEELYVSSCYADEGATIKRWRPRARGRATRIRKRTCHITVIVSRLPEDRLERIRARQAAELAMRRARRVAGQRQSESRRRRTGAGEDAVTDETAADQTAAEAAEEAGIVDQQAPAVEAAESGAPAAEATPAEETPAGGTAGSAEETPAEGATGSAEAATGSAEAAEQAGIVDQQAAAVEAAEGATEPAPGTTEEEGS